MKYWYIVEVNFDGNQETFGVQAGSVHRATTLGQKLARKKHRERNGSRSRRRKPRIIAVRERGEVNASD